MNSIDLLTMTLKNLLRRKIRTMLTVTGVLIGTASIIIMVSIGIGMNEGFKAELARMGSLNIINVRPASQGMHMTPDQNGGPGRGQGKQQELDEQAVVLFATIPEVEAVLPFIEVPGKLVAGKYQAHVSIQGVDPGQMDKLNLIAREGRLLQNGDDINMLFGAEIANFFYNPMARQYAPAEIDLMKDRLTLSLDMSYGESRADSEDGGKAPKAYTVKVTGILEGGNYENDYNVFMPLESLKKLVREHNRGRKQNETIKIDEYSKIMVKVKDINDVQRVQQQIKDQGFYADSLTDILASMQKAAAGIQRVLGVIGAVSLLIAAIGITNTMVMSIYERTREIGIMKVIGASLGDIRKLFLLESGMIGFFGGVIGIGFSYGVSYVLNTTGFVLFETGMQGGTGNTSIIPLWLAASALAFTSLIGLLSGYYPASRAMNLSALEAIKKE